MRDYAKFLEADSRSNSTVERWKPYVGDNMKRIVVSGYTGEELHRQFGWTELYLFENYDAMTETEGL